MTTPLPPKAVIDTHIPTGTKIYGYTADQIRDYGAAEYKRGIEAAAEICQDYDNCNPDYIAAAIRKLGEKS